MKPLEPSTPRLVRIAQRSSQWAERWYPDTFVIVVVTLAIVALAACLNGTRPAAVAGSFGEGF